VILAATGAATYSWLPATGLSNPSIANPVASPSNTTEFIVTGTTVNGCTDKDTVVISTFVKPVITKTVDTSICYHTPVSLFATGGLSYQWSPAASLSNAGISNPVATPDTSTLYYVAITDANNCSYRDSVAVALIPRPLFTASPSQPLCIGSAITLHAAGGDTYAWSPATGLDDATSANPVATPHATIQYTVHITESVCQYDSIINMTITVNPVPDVTAYKSSDVDCTVTMAQLNATGASRYVWTPAASLQGDVDKPNPVTNIDTTTLFTVQGFNSYGCSDMDSVLVKVTSTNIPVFAVPNAFTPNGDGKNDCFGIRRWGRVKVEEFAVFNRWGQKLFSTKDPAQCWDGTYNSKPQASGGYVYVITGQSFCGPVKRTGMLMLVR
jgi:gliding motility-associated-like protein